MPSVWSLNRLTVVGGEYSASYAYDQTGGLTSKIEAGRTVTMTYTNAAPAHAPKTVNGASVGYDGNGNTTTRAGDEAGYSQTWDAANRLSTVSNGATTVTNRYLTAS